MSDYVEKSAPPSKPIFRFRWRYTIAGFLVFGVLSLTIGQEDPLIRDAKILRGKYDAVFKINKDEKTASSAALDGPEEKTYPLNAPALQSLSKEIFQFGRRVSNESMKRGAKFEVSDPQTAGVVNAALVYQSMQLGLYKNYLRLAHDEKYSLYERTSDFGSVATYLAAIIPSGANAASGAALYSTWEAERWEKLNRDAIAMPGSRKYSPNAYDIYNIRLHPRTAAALIGKRELGKQFSVRNLKDEKGHYGSVELFLNYFDKQMAEFEAIMVPKDKGEYMKLLQFAALREGMANRWAVRRLADGMGLRIVRPQGKMPLAFADEAVKSCGPDLISFRFEKKGNLNDLEAYNSLWQQDRRDDLVAIGGAAAVAATADKPIATPDQVAQAYLEYVSSFAEFYPRVMAKFDVGGDAKKTLAAIKKHYVQDSFLDIQETRTQQILKVVENGWSKPQKNKDGVVLPAVATEAFLRANLPADDLSIPAVAERYADRAYLYRLENFANTLHKLAIIDSEPLAELRLPSGSAPEVAVEVDPYDTAPVPTVRASAPRAAPTQVLLYSQAADPRHLARAYEIVMRLQAPHEKAWKAGVAKEIEKALLSKLGVGLLSANGRSLGTGYLHSQDALRFQKFEEDVMKAAVAGARAAPNRKLAEKAISELNAKVEAAWKCTRSAPTRMASPTDNHCALSVPDPVLEKDKKSAVNYGGYAPFRRPASEFGMKELLLPESPDQLSQFFRKKIQSVLEFPNDHTRYAEPEIAEEIAGNATVMRGMEMLFGQISELASKEGGAGSVNDCGNVLSQVGHVRPKQLAASLRKSRGDAKQASRTLTAEECAQPGNAESKSKRKALEDAIIPGAKKAYAEFIKGLETAGTYKFPERAKLALEQQKKKAAEDKQKAAEKKVADQKKYEEALETPYAGFGAKLLERSMEAEEVAKKNAALTLQNSKKQAVLSMKYGYFRTGKDRSLEKSGGELYLPTVAEREKAKRLYIEALGMLGIASEVTGTKATFRVSNPNYATQVISWVTTERLIEMRMSRSSLFERMFSTVTDQLALAKVFEQESIARGPILTLRRSWRVPEGLGKYAKGKLKNDRDDPILLDRVSKYYSEKGWDKAGFDAEFKKTLTSAAVNDIGKVETFCKADIRNYKIDPNFKLLFQTASGVRSLYADNENVRKWDEEIAEETKSGWERWADIHFGNMWTMLVGMFLVQIVLQVGLAIITGGTSVLITAVVSGLAGRGIFAFIAGLAAAQVAGNFGIVNLFFSSQSVAMFVAYHFLMPPQLAFTYESANSQIQNMEANRFDGTAAATLGNGNVSFVDREKLNLARNDLGSLQSSAYIAGAMEVAQLAVFTAPGVYRSLGLSGQARLTRLGSASTSELVKSVGTESFRDVWKRTKNFDEAMAEYWPKVRQAVVTLTRINVVKGGAKVERQLEKMLADKLAHEIFPDREALRKFLELSKSHAERRISEIVAERGSGTLKNSARTAAELKQIEEDFLFAVKGVRPDALEEIERIALESTQDEAAVLLVDRRLSERLAAEARVADRIVEKSVDKNFVSHFFDFTGKEVTRLREEAKQFEKMLAELDSEALRADTVPEFLARHSPGDFALIGQYANKAGSLYSSQAYWNVRQAFKDFKYLHEDWLRADPIARAYARNLSQSLPSLIVDKEGVVWKAEDFVRNRDGTFTATRKVVSVGSRKEKDLLGTPLNETSQMRFDLDPRDFFAHPDDYVSIGSIIRKKNAPEVSGLRGVQPAREKADARKAVVESIRDNQKKQREIRTDK